MTRCIVIFHADEACGWTVQEDGKTSGALSTDEAVAHVAALMLRGWNGFPMLSIADAASALHCEQRQGRGVVEVVDTEVSA
jgi:hypothetical protein